MEDVAVETSLMQELGNISDSDALNFNNKLNLQDIPTPPSPSSQAGNDKNESTDPTKLDLKRVMQAKKRLQAFCSAKLSTPLNNAATSNKATPWKSVMVSQEVYDEKGNKMDLIVPLRKPPLKKGQNPTDRAKAVIEEIEEIKKKELEEYKQHLMAVSLVTAEAESRSKIIEQGNHFKRREVRSRNYRRSDYDGRSPSPERQSSHSSHSSKHSSKRSSYPENWDNFKANSFDFVKIRELNEKRIAKRHDDYNDYSQHIMWKTSAQLIEPFKAKGISNKAIMVPFPMVRFTTTNPRVPYSANISLFREVYFSRKEIFKYTKTEYKDLILKLIESAAALKIKPPKKISTRNWFPKNWKGADNNECKLLENSIGLSFLQSYSGEEEEEEDEDEEIIDGTEVRDEVFANESSVAVEEPKVLVYSEKNDIEKSVKNEGDIKASPSPKICIDDVKDLESDDVKPTKSEDSINICERIYDIVNEPDLSKEVKELKEISETKKEDSKDKPDLSNTPERNDIEIEVVNSEKPDTSDEFKSSKKKKKKLKSSKKTKESRKTEDIEKELFEIEERLRQHKQKMKKKKKKVDKDDSSDEEVVERKQKRKKSKLKRKRYSDDDESDSEDEKKEKLKKKCKVKKIKIRKNKKQTRSEGNSKREEKTKKKEKHVDDDDENQKKKKKKKKRKKERSKSNDSSRCDTEIEEKNKSKKHKHKKGKKDCSVEDVSIAPIEDFKLEKSQEKEVHPLKSRDSSKTTEDLDKPDSIREINSSRKVSECENKRRMNIELSIDTNQSDETYERSTEYKSKEVKSKIEIHYPTKERIVTLEDKESDKNTCEENQNESSSSKKKKEDDDYRKKIDSRSRSNKEKKKEKDRETSIDRIKEKSKRNKGKEKVNEKERNRRKSREKRKESNNDSSKDNKKKKHFREHSKKSMDESDGFTVVDSTGIEENSKKGRRKLDKKDGLTAEDLEPISPQEFDVIDKIGNTSDTDETQSVWETEDEASTSFSPDRRKLNRYGESDEELFDRSYTSSSHNSSQRDMQLEMPLHLSKFTRRRKGRWDQQSHSSSRSSYLDTNSELRLLEIERETLNAEKRKLEIERMKIEDMERERIREMEKEMELERQRQKNLELSLKEKEHADRGSKASVNEEKMKEKLDKENRTQNANKEASKIRKTERRTSTPVFDLSLVKNEPPDNYINDNSVSVSSGDIVSERNSQTSVTPAVLENEYEEFMKAVGSDVSSSKPDLSFKHSALVDSPVKSVSMKRDAKSISDASKPILLGIVPNQSIQEPIVITKSVDIMTNVLPEKIPLSEITCSASIPAPVPSPQVVKQDQNVSETVECESIRKPHDKVNKAASSADVPIVNSTPLVDETVTAQKESRKRPFAFTSMTLPSKRILLDNSALKLNDDSDNENFTGKMIKKIDDLSTAISELKDKQILNKEADKKSHIVEIKKDTVPEKSDKIDVKSKHASEKQIRNRSRSRSRSPLHHTYIERTSSYERDHRKPEHPRSPQRRSRRSRSASPKRYGSPHRRSPRRRHYGSPLRSPTYSDKKRSSPRRSSTSSRFRHISPSREDPLHHDYLTKSSQEGHREKTYEYRQKSPIHSPLQGTKRSVADSTISDDLLPQPSNEDYIELTTLLMDNKQYPHRDLHKSPKRLSLDDRISQVLGIKKQVPKTALSEYQMYNDQYGYYDQYGQYVHYNIYSQQISQSGFHQNVTNHEASSVNSNAVNDSQRRLNSTKVVQVGNFLEVVPTEDIQPCIVQPQVTKQYTKKENKKPSEITQKIVQIGNMLEIVPIEPPKPKEPAKPKPKVVAAPPPPPPLPSPNQQMIPLSQPPKRDIALKTPVTPAVAESIVEKQTAEELLKQRIAERRAERDKRRTERERKRKEKEKKKKDKEKQKQLKLKLKTEDIIKRALLMEAEGDMDDEENENDSLQWPPVPIIISSNDGKEPGKSILLSGGYRIAEDAEKSLLGKSVKFADGVRPGEGTSPSAGEELSSPPPPAVLPKEKRYKKTKIPKKSKKKKIKVKVIKRRAVTEDSEDSEEENLPPPPPPPGSPPPHLFPPRIKTHTINNIKPTYVSDITQLPPPLPPQTSQAPPLPPSVSVQPPLPSHFQPPLPTTPQPAASRPMLPPTPTGQPLFSTNTQQPPPTITPSHLSFSTPTQPPPPPSNQMANYRPPVSINPPLQGSTTFLGQTYQLNHNINILPQSSNQLGQGIGTSMGMVTQNPSALTSTVLGAIQGKNKLSEAMNQAIQATLNASNQGGMNFNLNQMVVGQSQITTGNIGAQSSHSMLGRLSSDNYQDPTPSHHSSDRHFHNRRGDDRRNDGPRGHSSSFHRPRHFSPRGSGYSRGHPRLGHRHKDGNMRHRRPF